MDTELIFVWAVVILIAMVCVGYILWKKKIKNNEKIDLEDIIEAGKEVKEHLPEIKEIAEDIVEGDKEALKNKVIEHKDDILKEIDEVIDEVKGD